MTVTVTVDGPPVVVGSGGGTGPVVGGVGLGVDVGDSVVVDSVVVDSVVVDSVVVDVVDSVVDVVVSVVAVVVSVVDVVAVVVVAWHPSIIGTASGPFPIGTSSDPQSSDWPSQTFWLSQSKTAYADRRKVSPKMGKGSTPLLVSWTFSSLHS